MPNGCWLAGFPIASGEENEMSKAYTCRDIGKMECEWRVSAETEGELLRLIGKHLAEAHGMTDTPPDLLQQVRKAIKDE